MPKIIFIGEKEIVRGWQGLGLDIFVAEDNQQVRAGLERALQEKYDLVYLSETNVDKNQLEDILKKVSSQPNLGLTFVSGKVKKGLGQERLRLFSKKALGTDITGD